MLCTDVRFSPLGAMLRPMLDSMSVRPTEGQNVDTRSVPFYTASSTTTQSSHTVEPLETETKSKETESKEAKQDEEFAPIKRQIYWSKEEVRIVLILSLSVDELSAEGSE